MREHPGKSLKDPAPLDTACSEAPAKKRKVERKLPGHDALMAAMDEAAGIAPASEQPAVEADGAEQAEAVAVVSDRTIGALMDSQLDTWCSGGPIVDVRRRELASVLAKGGESQNLFVHPGWRFGFAGGAVSQCVGRAVLLQSCAGHY